MKHNEPAPIRQRNPLEQSRAPDAPLPARGDQPGKRDNDESNDPESEPGARRGKHEAAN